MNDEYKILGMWAKTELLVQALKKGNIFVVLFANSINKSNYLN